MDFAQAQQMKLDQREALASAISGYGISMMPGTGSIPPAPGIGRFGPLQNVSRMGDAGASVAASGVLQDWHHQKHRHKHAPSSQQVLAAFPTASGPNGQGHVPFAKMGKQAASMGIEELKLRLPDMNGRGGGGRRKRMDPFSDPANVRCLNEWQLQYIDKNLSYHEHVEKTLVAILQELTSQGLSFRIGPQKMRQQHHDILEARITDFIQDFIRVAISVGVVVVRGCADDDMIMLPKVVPPSMISLEFVILDTMQYKYRPLMGGVVMENVFIFEIFRPTPQGFLTSPLSKLIGPSMFINHLSRLYITSSNGQAKPPIVINVDNESKWRTQLTVNAATKMATSGGHGGGGARKWRTQWRFGQCGRIHVDLGATIWSRCAWWRWIHGSRGLGGLWQHG
jgi:hypothetical protein